MKLHLSPASPYARKTLLAAAELGLLGQIEIVRATATPTATESPLDTLNPLAKIPTLELASGEALFDSRVIVAYFESLGERRLTPASGKARFLALRHEAAADGMNDAALLLRYETFLRPEPLRWLAWSEGQTRKISQALSFLAELDYDLGENIGLGEIATYCALEYLDFRFPEIAWRVEHAKLAGVFAAIEARPSAKHLPDQTS